MSRSALRLAALASSAVPGLDPVSVQGVRVRLGDLYECAFLSDSRDRRWVVKASRTAARGVLLEDVNILLTLLGRRLEVTLPVLRGAAGLPGAPRVVVYPRVPGHGLDFAALPAGAPVAAEVGRTLAHVHNVELALFEEAGRPSYDADTHRKRMLSELDRASTSGHVPSGLLSRWEHRLEDVSLWRFAPTPVHGAYTGSHVLVTLDGEDGSGNARVRGLIGWEEARVGDPADDLAELVGRASPAALDTVLEAYAQSRVERPDANLMQRARLAAEMSLVHRLLRGLSADEPRLVRRLATELQALDEHIRDAEERAEALRLRAEREARRAREAELAAAATSPPTSSALAPSTTADEPTQPFTLSSTSSPERPGALPRGAGHARSDGPEHEVSDPGADDAVEDAHEGASDFVAVRSAARQRRGGGASAEP